jgi:hypothetical protein
MPTINATVALSITSMTQDVAGNTALCTLAETTSSGAIRIIPDLTGALTVMQVIAPMETAVQVSFTVPSSFTDPTSGIEYSNIVISNVVIDVGSITVANEITASTPPYSASNLPSITDQNNYDAFCYDITLQATPENSTTALSFLWDPGVENEN